jgi:hypothetical protein
VCLCVDTLKMNHLVHIELLTTYIKPKCLFEMCQDCQHSNFCYECIFAKPFKKCLVCEVDVLDLSCCVQIDTKSEVTSPFKNSK